MISVQFSPDNKQIVTLSNNIQVSEGEREIGRERGKERMRERGEREEREREGGWKKREK